LFSKDFEVIAWDKEDIDITDRDLILAKISALSPDIIINCAAYNNVDACENDEDQFSLAMRLNKDAVANLADASLKDGILFVHFSSDHVFSGEKKDGYMEDDEPAPINKYAQTKLAGEQEIIKRSGKGLKWYLIRTSKLFGPKGGSYVSKPSFFDLILKLSKEKDEFNMVTNEVSCFTYTPDLADSAKKLIESGKGYGIYHLANQGASSWYDGAKELFELTGTKSKINPVLSEDLPRPAKRPHYTILLNTKFEQLRDWRSALKEYIKNYIK
jgi:dTDP-4-dehydrorhamnose reductase